MTRRFKIGSLAVSCLIAAVAPASSDPVVGAWSDVLDWPIVGIHMVQLHTGEILVFSNGSEEAHILDPTEAVDCLDEAGGCFTQKLNPVEIFCAGHTHLDDGTVIVNGGHIQNNVGEPDTFLLEYDQDAGEWNWSAVGEYEDTDFARWYPTLTSLPDGRVLNVSGSQRRCSSGLNQGALCREHADCEPEATENCEVELVAIPEIFDASKSWSSLTGITSSVEFYPFNFVDPDGNIFFAGADSGAGVYDIAPTQSAIFDVDDQTVTLGPVSTTAGGSAAMHAPGRILKAGGTAGTSDAIADAEIIDLNGAALWQATGSMNIPRRRHNLTVLPDGTVLVNGGTRLGNREFEVDRTCGGDDLGDPCCRDSNCSGGLTCEVHTMGDQMWVEEAELWDPATGTWTLMSGAQRPRMYHSTALLLRDGRVLTAGGGRGGCALNSYPDAEVFSPPYLFTETPRPVIEEAPDWITYGQTFRVQSPEPVDVDQVNLIRLGAVTHSFDQDRRFVPLTFNQVGDHGLDVAAPSSPNVAPPGYYMLFLLSSEGVPSIASFIRIVATPSAPFEYTAKVVCGLQDTQEPSATPHAPGHYATSINIHNPGREPALFFKKLALTYPPGDQRAGEILPVTEHLLRYDEALQSDCSDLRRRLIPGGSAPYFEGYLVLQSQARLDVTGVYSTAAVGPNGVPQDHSSVDVERVPERARNSDLGVNKTAVPLPPIEISDNAALHFALYTIQVSNSGPDLASNIVLSDDLALDVTGGLGFATISPSPMVLPPGSVVTSHTQPAFNLSSIQIELPDLAPGDTHVVQFWALALTYRFADQDLDAVLRDTVSISSSADDGNLANNSVTVQTVLVP